jgi:transcriptional regulator of acetoin/glycerol metabolism
LDCLTLGFSNLPADLTPEKITHARQMIQSEEQSVSGMAKLLGVHRVTVHKALKRTAGL